MFWGRILLTPTIEKIIFLSSFSIFCKISNFSEIRAICYICGMKNNISAAVLALAVLAAVPAGAQTKKETKAYGKAVAKDKVADYEKFLKKFPESVYTEDVTLRRDTRVFSSIDREDVVAVEDFLAKYPQTALRPEAEELCKSLNTSRMTPEEVAETAARVLPGAKSPSAIRYRNRERIYALPADSLAIVRTEFDGQSWSAPAAIPVERYILDGALDGPAPEGPIDFPYIGSRRYVLFSYTNGSGSEKEFVSVLADLASEEVTQAMFRGRVLGGVIEGESPERLSMTTGGSAETAWLLGSFRENPLLKEISGADAAADESVRWWYSRNPNASSGAKKRLYFGVLEGENSIIDAFGKARLKARSGSWAAAWFNHRGNSIVCAYNSASGEYVLVWCEPVNTRGRAGRDLQTIYFETGTSTLDMVYYQGKKTFKQKINLSGKTMTVS